jgi:hypothetical protein
LQLKAHVQEKHLNKMNKKAANDVLYMVGAGFLIFLIITFGLGNVVKNIFNNFKNSEQSIDALIDVTKSMAEAGNNIKVTLVHLKLDDETAVFVFTGNSDDLIENKVDIVGTSKYNDRTIVKKPAQCKGINDCICLCKEFSKVTIQEDDKKVLLDKYDAKAAFEIGCEKGIICSSLDNNPEDKIFQDTTLLKDIVSETDYKVLQNSVPQEWEGGFSFYRTEKYGSQLTKTKFTDVYVVKNDEGKLYYCFDHQKCADIY